MPWPGKDFAEPLVQNVDWDRVVPHLPEFARAFREKGCPYPNLGFLIDGTFRSTCRPGGRDSRQRALYSGNNKSHGFNYQGLTTPDGIIVQAWGPAQGRCHDLGLMRESKIMEQIAQHAKIGYRQFIVFGDLGYQRTDLLQCGFKGELPESSLTLSS